LASRYLLLLLGAAVTIFASNGLASDRQETWVFSSIYGNERTLSRDTEGNYSISVADVTAVTEACDEEHYRVCVSSRWLSVAIPREPPRMDSTWTVGPATYSVLSIVARTKLLGKDVRDLYAVDVYRAAVPPLDVVAHRFRLFFSYSDGLLAFGELGDTGKPPYLYFASRTPSFGATD
jgi:hypothetical protein